MLAKEYLKHIFKKRSTYIVCTPFLLGVESPNKFSKRGSDRISILRAIFLEKKGCFFEKGEGRIVVVI